MEEKTIDETRQGEYMMLESTNIQNGFGRKLLLESYGCQMNFSDSEIVASILTKEGFVTTRDAEEADLILLNTCAIRDNAEQRVRERLACAGVAACRTITITVARAHLQVDVRRQTRPGIGLRWCGRTATIDGDTAG